MTDELLSSSERDALSEDALIEHDLRHVNNAAGLTGAALRRLLRDRIRRERAKKAEARRISRLAEEFGTTEIAIRKAETEASAERRRVEWQRQMSVARRAVGADEPAPPTSYAMQMIPRLEAKWRALEAPGGRPSIRLVSDLVGVDRGSVRRWMDAGWLRLPPG